MGKAKPRISSEVFGTGINRKIRRRYEINGPRPDVVHNSTGAVHLPNDDLSDRQSWGMVNSLNPGWWETYISA